MENCNNRILDLLENANNKTTIPEGKKKAKVHFHKNNKKINIIGNVDMFQ